MDKKINQLDPAGAVAGTDLLPIVQDLATGKALKTSLDELKSYIVTGSIVGCEAFFMPMAATEGFAADIGKDGDIWFDLVGRGLYSKIDGDWFLQTTWISSAVDLVAVKRLAAPATATTTVTDTDLIGKAILGVMVETTTLIPKAPLIALQPDEFDFDIITGTLTFGQLQNAGARITVNYAVL